MRGEILGPVACTMGGVILPRGAGAATLLWSIAGTTQITEDAANAAYTVSYGNTLSPGQSATVAVGSAAGTATDGVDYTGASTTLTFTGGGATAKTLAATIIEDTIVEGAEDFRVILANPSTGQLATSQVTTAIADEDASLIAWSVSGPSAIDEGDAGTYMVGYTGATLAVAQQATVTVASAAGVLTWPDATAGSDYTALSTVLTFTGGGATEKTVAVSTVDDTNVDGTEDFRVTIGGASIGSLAASQANTVIADDDAAPEPLLDAVAGGAQAYSMRKLRAAYSGPCIRLRRSSDDAESDFGFDGSGNLDTGAIASWLGGGTGFVATWYDQSGNGKNLTQVTAAAQPTYLANWHNGLPGVRFVAANSTYLVVDITTGLQLTMFMVAEGVGTDTGEQVFVSQSGAPTRYLSYLTSAARVFLGSIAESGTFPVPRQDPHLLEFQRSGTGSTISWWQNGSAIGTPSANTNTCHFEEFGRNANGPTSNKFDGVIAEFASFEPNLIEEERLVVENNLETYWAI